MSRSQIKQKKAAHSFTQKLKNEHSKYKTPTDDDDPTLPALMVFQGMRGSGKTHSAVTLAKYFEKKGYIAIKIRLNPNSRANSSVARGHSALLLTATVVGTARANGRKLTASSVARDRS